MYRFCEFLDNRGYSHEAQILHLLPFLDPVEQVKLDMELNSQGSRRFGPMMHQDNQWKQKVLEIFQGTERDPNIIRQTIDIIRRDIGSHMNHMPSPNTGSAVWHATWIGVYNSWLKQLEGALHATQG